MEDQAIGFHGQAGEREKMMLYKKPLVGRILSSRLLLFAAVGLMLTPSTATEREGHDQRTPTPHPRPHPRPSQAAETPLPLPGAGALPSYYRKHARVESRFLEWLAERRLMCGMEKQSRVIL